MKSEHVTLSPLLLKEIGAVVRDHYWSNRQAMSEIDTKTLVKSRVLPALESVLNSSMNWCEEKCARKMESKTKKKVEDTVVDVQ